ncbi:MAG: hypothetical protein ACRC37_00465, partial [Lentisphaeria bacterium]
TLMDEGLVIYNEEDKTYKSAWIFLPYHPKVQVRNIIDDTLNEIAKISGLTSEWYHPSGESLVLSSRILLSKAKIQAKVGFHRAIYGELEAVSRVALSTLQKLDTYEGFWRWDNNKIVEISKEQVEEILKFDKKNAVAIDFGFNIHGVRRYAVGVVVDEELFGVIALAESKSDVVLGREEFLRDKLNQIANEMVKSISLLKKDGDL